MSASERETCETLDLKFNEQGLIPAIVQDVDTGEVLMLGWMNAQAVRMTLATAKATFFSRSRNKIWVKGESSGHEQKIVEFRVDCDQDTILLRCKSLGPCCHVGYQTCFYRAGAGSGDRLKLVEKKVFDPQSVYGS